MFNLLSHFIDQPGLLPNLWIAYISLICSFNLELQPGNFCLNLDQNKKPILFCIDLGKTKLFKCCDTFSNNLPALLICASKLNTSPATISKLWSLLFLNLHITDVVYNCLFASGLSMPSPTEEEVNMHQQFQGTPDYASTQGLLNKVQVQRQTCDTIFCPSVIFCRGIFLTKGLCLLTRFNWPALFFARSR